MAFNLDLFRRSDMDDCIAILQGAEKKDLENPEVCEEIRTAIKSLLPECPKDGQDDSFFRQRTLKICNILSRDEYGSNAIARLSSRTLATILRLIVKTTEEKKEVSLAKDCFSVIVFNEDEFMIDNDVLYALGQIFVPDIDDEKLAEKAIEVLELSFKS